MTLEIARLNSNTNCDGTFTRGVSVCNKDWEHRTAIIVMDHKANECIVSSDNPDKILALVNRGIANFNSNVKKIWVAAACRNLDDVMTKVEDISKKYGILG